MQPPPPSPSSSAVESLKELYALFGRAVFLVLPRGEKKLEDKGWDQITFEQTQTSAYQRALVKALARGGNLPSFKGKSALIHKAVSAWNRTMTLSVNIRDEQYDQQRRK